MNIIDLIIIIIFDGENCPEGCSRPNRLQSPNEGSSPLTQIRQYLVFGRRDPSPTDPNPTVLALRVFAKNTVIAKSKFWYHMRKQQKLKSAQGQILGVNQVDGDLFRSLRETPTLSKLMESFSSINQELATTTCTKNSEM